MANVKGDNVTKYDAGGSGDNIIADGYIKTVEKVWLDSYTFAAAIPSGTTLDLCVLPAGKKITGITIWYPALSTGASGTGTTLSIGDAGSATRYLNAYEAAAAAARIDALDLVGGAQYVPTGTTNRIIMTFGRIATTTTAGTIKWIVRYT